MDDDFNNNASWLRIITGISLTILAVFGVAALVNVLGNNAYQNSLFTIGEVLRVDEEEDLVYKYRVNGTIQVGHSVHEFQGTDYSTYYKSVGKYFLVRYNSLHPGAAVIYVSCQLPDSLSEPNAGWVTPPVKCAKVGEKKSWFQRLFK